MQLFMGGPLIGRESSDTTKDAGDNQSKLFNGFLMIVVYKGHKPTETH